MPNCVMESDISNAAKVCYLALAYFAGKEKDTCWPSQSVLAAKYNSNERSTREHLTELEEAGFIKIKQNGLRRSNTYEFLSLEDRDSCSAENRRSGTAESPAQGTAENRLSCSAENRLSFPISEPLSYEPLSNTKSINPEELSPSEGQELSLSTPEHPMELDQKPKAAPAADFETQSTLQEVSTLQLEDDVLDFIVNVYRRTRRVKIKRAFLRPLESDIKRKESDLSPMEFRAALCRYLDSSSPWLIENAWPIKAFLKKPTDYLSDHPAVNRHAAPSSATASRTIQTTPEVADALKRDCEPIPPDVLTYVDKWNTLIPDFPCIRLARFQIEEARKTIANAEFRELWSEIVAKMALVATSRPDAMKTFSTIMDPSFNGATWKSVVNGKLDWATKPKTGAQSSAFDELEKKLEREATEKVCS